MRSLLALLLALSACGDQAPAPEPKAEAPAKPVRGIDRSQAGKEAPETPFEDPDGEPVTLAQFRGKPVLLNLWATWCAPCVKELPTLDALAVREGNRLQVLTVSQDMEGREKVEQFLSKRGFKAIDSYLAPEMQLMDSLKIDTLPTTILYDAKGREVWRMAGDEDWTGAKAAALIAEAR
jgi:thiol-disulfide isomerase/thioredoxin